MGKKGKIFSSFIETSFVFIAKIRNCGEENFFGTL